MLDIDEYKTNGKILVYWIHTLIATEKKTCNPNVVWRKARLPVHAHLSKILLRKFFLNKWKAVWVFWRIDLTSFTGELYDSILFILILILSKIRLMGSQWVEKSRNEPKPKINYFLSFGNNWKEYYSTKNQITCVDCKSDNLWTDRCPHFISLTIDQRCALVKLAVSTGVVTRKWWYKCRLCQRNHHTLLHQVQDASTKLAQLSFSSNSTRQHVANSQPVSLNTIVYKTGPKSPFRESIIHILPTSW